MTLEAAGQGSGGPPFLWVEHLPAHAYLGPGNPSWGGKNIFILLFECEKWVIGQNWRW